MIILILTKDNGNIAPRFGIFYRRISVNKIRNAALTLMLLATTACATNIHRSDSQADPYENVNRKIFAFNNQVYENVFFPIARGYRKITTPFVRERINSFISNMDEPISAVNHLLQLKPKETLINLGRVVINTTLGLGGMFDVAQGWGLEPDKGTFNETMASWCVADGPYLVMPFVGGSTARGIVGMGADAVADPVYWMTYHDANYSAKISYPYAAVKYTAKAESYMDLYEGFRKDSVDFYATLRSAFLQSQRNLNCRFASDEDMQQTYDFDFDEEDFDEE
jgi:phospholipid-binding lipoprotein MlaA